MYYIYIYYCPVLAKGSEWRRDLSWPLARRSAPAKHQEKDDIWMHMSINIGHSTCI